jgi:hypothetical protein
MKYMTQGFLFWFSLLSYFRTVLRDNSKISLVGMKFLPQQLDRLQKYSIASQTRYNGKYGALHQSISP